MLALAARTAFTSRRWMPCAGRALHCWYGVPAAGQRRLVLWNFIRLTACLASRKRLVHALLVLRTVTYGPAQARSVHASEARLENRWTWRHGSHTTAGWRKPRPGGRLHMVGRWQVPDVADVRRDARGDAGDARSVGGAGSAGDAGVGSAGNADVGSAGDAGNAGGTGDAGRAARAAVVVRLATLADIDAVSVIESAAFADPWPAEAFQAQLARSVVWFAVAELHDEVVGYVVEIVVGDEAEIANIAVGS